MQVIFEANKWEDFTQNRLQSLFKGLNDKFDLVNKKLIVMENASNGF